MNLLVKMNKTRNSTFVYVSHDMDIARYAKRTIVLNDGRIIDDNVDSHQDLKKIFERLSNSNNKKRRKKSR
jgi:ABC-type lipoprotein export system ATPase subunit